MEYCFSGPVTMCKVFCVLGLCIAYPFIFFSIMIGLAVVLEKLEQWIANRK